MLEIWTETADDVWQCGLRFCSQCLTDWHDSKSCDENMTAIHGQIDGSVLFSLYASIFCNIFTVYLRVFSPLFNGNYVFCKSRWWN